MNLMYEERIPNIQPQLKLKLEGKALRKRQTQNSHSYCRKQTVLTQQMKLQPMNVNLGTVQ